MTDPPYGDTALEWDRWPDGWPSIVPAAVVQMWCFGSMRMWLDRAGEFRSASWTYGQEVVWEKHNGSGFLADRFKRVHEFAMHWYRGTWGALTINPQMTNDAQARTVRRKARPAHMGNVGSHEFVAIDGGPRLMRSVLYVRSEHGRALHPTQKPVELLAPLIAYSTDRGDVVIDPFAGSGSTLVAATLAGRRSIGIEADEQSCEIAARRCSQGTLNLAGGS